MRLTAAERRRVWIADDSALELQRGTQALGHNFGVETFPDGAAVLERLHTHAPPDVLVIDWNMPGVTGVEVCRFLRQDRTTRELPVLILTGTHRTTEDIVEALASGANDFLPKPYVDAELLARVNALVRTTTLHQRIARAEKELRTLFAELPDPLIAVSESLQVVFMNAEASRVFGDAPPGELAALMPSLVPQTPESPRQLTIVGRVYAPAVRRVELEQGVRTWAVTLRDVTEVVQAVRARDEFLAMLAHELRNPLAPIVTALELMKLDRGDDQTRQRAEAVVERQVGRLRRLVDDLIDVSRITRGKIELRKELLDLGAAVDAALESVQPLVTDRGHRLDVERPDEPVMVEADPIRLEQILTNLLTNAARYTEAGGRVRVKLDAEGGDATVRVIDNGCGISPEQLPRIFELFVQGQSGLDRSGAGLGIGLTLVKRLTEAHGGTIEAHSEGLTRGSEFVLRLPYAGTAKLRAHVAPVERPTRALRTTELRILVVDDNADAADLLGEMLALEGDQVRVIHDGQVALETAREFRPDVVLLDIGLPVLDGYSVARQLRADPLLRGVLLVAVTGYGQSRDVRLSQDAGFDAHMVKPLLLSEIRRVIDRELEQRGARA